MFISLNYCGKRRFKWAFLLSDFLCILIIALQYSSLQLILAKNINLKYKYNFCHNLQTCMTVTQKKIFIFF